MSDTGGDSDPDPGRRDSGGLFERLAEAAFDPVAYAVARVGDRKPVVGTVGFDVPREILIAAEMLPLQLRARSTVASDRLDLAAMALDPVATCHVAGLLSGAYEPLDFLVVSHDRAMNAKLFFVLRELNRLGELPRRPELAFLDLRHLPRVTTDEYNRRRLRQFAELVGRWNGGTVAVADLRRGIAIENEIRALLAVVRDARGGPDTPLSGVEGLGVMGAAQVVEHDEYREAVRSLLEGVAERPPYRGRRLFVSGSTPEDLAPYQLLESVGGLVVGEDHDLGRWVVADPIPETADPLDDLVQASRASLPAAAWGSLSTRTDRTVRGATEVAAEAVVAILYAHDTALGWEWRDTKRALERAGLDVLQLRLPFGAAPGPSERETVASFVGGEVLG